MYIDKIIKNQFVFDSGFLPQDLQLLLLSIFLLKNNIKIDIINIL